MFRIANGITSRSTACLVTTSLVPFSTVVCLSVCLLVMATASVSASDDPTYFRSNAGVYEQAAIPENFESGNSLRWRIELSPGNSTPCPTGRIAGG